MRQVLNFLETPSGFIFRNRIRFVANVKRTPEAYVCLPDFFETITSHKWSIID
jgi:hypothetical protein